jgi:YidC/Oxa1 family membrane protein insertase
MSHEKRIALAFGVSFAILVLWRTFFVPEPPPRSPQPPATVKPETALPEAVAPAPEEPMEEVPAPPPVPATIPVEKSEVAHEVTVESDFYRVTLTNEGAVVKSWILKNYVDKEGRPLELVNAPACEQLGFPLSLRLADSDLAKKINSARFVASATESSLAAPARVEFVFSDGTVQARKVLEFGAGYETRVEVSVADGRGFLPVEIAWPGGFGDHSLPERAASMSRRAVYQPAESSSVEEAHLQSSFLGRVSSWFGGTPKKETDLEVSGPLKLAGLADRYFLAVLIPEFQDARLEMLREEWTPPDWQGKDEEKPKPIGLRLGRREGQPAPFRLIVAPRDLQVLESLNPPLDHLVDYGWFWFIAKPLFSGMRHLHDHWVHNYGWAIVLLTIAINLALFPLRLKQIRSAQEMQRIAPLVKGIQEKYKHLKFNDPRKQRMQQEIMKLYKEHHVNPLGGCFPVLLQIPFFIGFYKVLDHSIELRHAPWIGWVRDLSSPDPYYILPSLMIVSMFVQQKMTPTPTVDPAQQRMMMLMPIFVGFFFFAFASGLVLYWLTSTIVGIVQQLLMNRLMPPPQPAYLARKAAETKS